MEFKNISAKLQVELKACKSEEELRALVKGEGLDLSDDALEGISGGKLVCIGNE